MLCLHKQRFSVRRSSDPLQCGGLKQRRLTNLVIKAKLQPQTPCLTSRRDALIQISDLEKDFCFVQSAQARLSFISCALELVSQSRELAQRLTGFTVEIS